MPNRGVEPLTELGRARRGPCSLCPAVGDRTLTHVPPRCADNDGSASLLCKTTDEIGVVSFVKGHERQGGSRFYSQCASCNGLVARYDPEWPLWVDEILRWLDSTARRVPDEGFPMILLARRPGSFVRSVLAGMFALTPTLRNGWPDLAEAIRTGAPISAPSDLRLLVHLYSGPRRFVTSGFGKMTYSFLRAADSSVEATLGEIAWPPFHFVLVDRRDVEGWPLGMDVTSWLEDDWQATRDVALLLKLPPIEDLFSSSIGRQASA
jgi:hypothetical protein